MSSPDTGFFVAAALPVLLVALAYAAGARRRLDAGRPVSIRRHAGFGAGLAVLLISLEWPFEAWAHQLFYIHQIGFMVARIIAPMLIILSRPLGLLIAGLPRSIRTSTLAPVLSTPAVRRIWRGLAHPVAALSLYLATLFFWVVPAVQDRAVAHPAVGYAMHLSLLLSGLLFWSRIFERRPRPHGAGHGSRLMMIWIAMLGQILLGAYLTVKTTITYPAYGTMTRLWMTAPIVDEGRGGFFIWIPSGLLSLAALILVVDMWGRHETRMDEKRRRWSPSNSAILLYPETARALREMTRGKNRRLAIGMIGFVLLIFSSVMGVMVAGHRLNRRENIRLLALSKS
ncbi:cytochrome c oxidase assembly protein [Sphingomonas sp. AR_OL41]|uniref:cytochrome c oxidase assembly protein n=1 Tax=Sphingomonas sp. AR_OL41 TaxID=3042729 RepID=UPI00248185DB|nr:cytochrome c oxidase assembly protein [Sphingomonas sp. AR_OL41]MDH7974195.1 cytochrome c oxidase assembly protein [Sphingomonas sp. AR_OL41]